MAKQEFAIEDFVAPERAPHKLTPLVTQLIEAGPDKVVSATYATEAEGKTFVSDFQAAARQAGVSGIKRAFVELEDGSFKVSMAVRDKITRNRGGNTPE